MAGIFLGTQRAGSICGTKKYPPIRAANAGLVFIEKPLLRSNAVNPPCNLEITELIHHNRFIGWTVNIPLIEALGPLYLIINEDLDDHVAPEDIVGA